MSFCSTNQVFLAFLGVLLGLGFTMHAEAETIDVWFGTARGGDSKGIYHATFNTETGKLSRGELAAEVAGPGFLAKRSDGTMLYAAAVDNGKPSIVAYRIEVSRGGSKLVKDSSVEVGDGGAAHVSVSPDDRVVLSAQYGGGSTAIYRLNDNGGLIDRAGLEKHPPGSGVVAGRQDKAHAHWTGTSPDGRFAFVPDLGMDKVVIYRLDSKAATLVPHGFGECPPGSGPRHMKFDPSGNRIYVLNELALSVTVFDYDSEAGTMHPIQTIATLSEATKSKEVFNSASEIRFHPSGRFVYTANRGNDTITVFAVDDQSGKLSVVEVEPIRGAWPRNFNLDPTGKWLLAAGKNTNSISIFQVNQETGELQFTRNSVLVPVPICVLF
ncbi:MAG: lactonase family protein [Planctomycetota bacterium]